MLTLLLLACARGPNAPAPIAAAPSAPATPSAAALLGAPAPTGTLGEDRWGFVEVVSPTGRTVAMRRFPAAPDGTAGPSPEFGHHGEAPEPTPVVIDTVTGATNQVDEIVLVGADLLHLLVLDEGKLWIVGTETGEWQAWTDPAPDLRDDHNRCLAPRVAAFDDLGGRVGVVSGDQLHVRDLATGETWAVPAGGSLWRGWPEAVGKGATLLVVDPPPPKPPEAEAPPKADAPKADAPPKAAPAPGGDRALVFEIAPPDFPVQRTSCACRWCNRFALSYGTYGWAGPAFRPVAASPAGPAAVERGAVAVGEGLYATASGVQRADGTAVPLPEGCSSPAALVVGSESVPLGCGDTTRLWWPATGRTVTLPERLAAVAADAPLVALRVGGARVVAVKLASGGYARLDLDAGALAAGPPGDEAAGPTPWGTLLVRKGPAVVAWSLLDGAVRPVTLPEGVTAVSVTESVVRLSDDTRLVVDATGAHTHVVERMASAPTLQGCVLVATALGDRDVERGPWRWACPAR